MLLYRSLTMSGCMTQLRGFFYSWRGFNALPLGAIIRVLNPRPIPFKNDDTSLLAARYRHVQPVGHHLNDWGSLSSEIAFMPYPLIFSWGDFLIWCLIVSMYDASKFPNLSGIMAAPSIPAYKSASCMPELESAAIHFGSSESLLQLPKRQ